MATTKRIKWHIKAFKELRKSRPIMSDMISRAREIASAAGAGYDVTPFTGKTRSRVSVMTATPEAIKDNALYNTLIRAIGAKEGDLVMRESGSTWYMTKSGKRIRATPTQIAYWTRNG